VLVRRALQVDAWGPQPTVTPWKNAATRSCTRLISDVCDHVWGVPCDGRSRHYEFELAELVCVSHIPLPPNVIDELVNSTRLNITMGIFRDMSYSLAQPQAWWAYMVPSPARAIEPCRPPSALQRLHDDGNKERADGCRVPRAPVSADAPLDCRPAAVGVALPLPAAWPRAGARRGRQIVRPQADASYVAHRGGIVTTVANQHVPPHASSSCGPSDAVLCLSRGWRAGQDQLEAEEFAKRDSKPKRETFCCLWEYDSADCLCLLARLVFLVGLTLLPWL
jgi:hypothetical protein